MPKPPPKSFLERCTSALVPSNWGIRSNWAKIPLTIVSPIWVGPGALGCFAAHEVAHAGHLPEIARATQQLRDTRIHRGPSGLPTLRSRQPLTARPQFRAARAVMPSRTEDAWQRRGRDSFRHVNRYRPDARTPGGGLSSFNTRLNVPGVSDRLRYRPTLPIDRPWSRPTSFQTGGLANFDTRLRAPASIASPSSPGGYGTGGLSNFNTRLNVPGLSR